MAGWTTEELQAIRNAEELDLQSRRRDGTLRDPVTIWVVELDGDLYIRAIGGLESPWFRGTGTRREGRIRAGGVEREVAFADPEGDVADALDRVYREKYGRYPERVLGTVLTQDARSATLRLVPRD